MERPALRSLRRTAGPSGPAVPSFHGAVRRTRGVRSSRRLPFPLALLTLFLVSCGGDRATPVDRAAPAVVPVRVAPREIALDLGDGAIQPEFSSLTWWQDRLLLLPQYPERVLPGSGPRIFFLTREEIRGALASPDTVALRPHTMDFDDGGLSRRVTGYDGYEAIAVDGRRVVLSIECRARRGWESVLVAGMLSDTPPRLVLDPGRRLVVPADSGRPNFSDEALVEARGEIWSIHELNGRAVNPRPRVHRIGPDLLLRGRLPMESVEYRITDATALDSDGRFWVFNQYWPGEARWVLPSADAMTDRDRPARRPVERIVALREVDERIVFDRERGVVELELRPDGLTRNWEGLARWEDGGFLVVTDTHPRTILAHVPPR